MSPLEIAAFAGIALPLLGLGAPSLLARVPRDARTPFALAALVAGSLLLLQIAHDKVDPYWLAIAAGTAGAALAALGREGARDGADTADGVTEPSSAGVARSGALTGTDLAVWLLLWIPFDLRWHETIVPGGEARAYAWTSLALVVAGALGWGRLREPTGRALGYRLVPRPRDLAIWLAGTALLMALLLPPSLALGFTHYPGKNALSLARMAAAAPEIFFTIALPEELFFRGVLQGGLERRWGGRRALLAASLAFGLMHWNNVGSLEEKVVYFVLASVAGAVYGQCYRLGGGLLGAALVHTSVDWLWLCFFT